MIVVECGSNNGNDIQLFLERWPEAIIYAIEPTIELYSLLLKRFGTNPRVKLLPLAIDTENSFKVFNIAGQSDWGCSSLHEFGEVSPLWGDRPDFKVTHSYYVPTMTLYDLCNMYKINQIDFLHIDTQGNDFNVLKSLRDKISIVKEGNCEAAYLTDLYKNVNNSYLDIVNFLNENGFSTFVHPHAHMCECDVNFKR